MDPDAAAHADVAADRADHADVDADEAAARTAALFDRSARDYENVGVDFFTVAGRRLVEIAAVAPGERVLDVGCGTGAVLVPAAEAAGADGSVEGVDLSAGMVDRCSEELRRRGLDGVVLRVGDAQDPEPLTAPVDVVLAGLVVFFLPRPDAAVRAWFDALGPAGRIALSTFGPEDPAMEPVYRSIVAHVPRDGAAPLRARDNPFTAEEHLTDVLRGAGAGEVLHRTEVLPVRFPDPASWIAWSWSHAGRGLWESVPEGPRAAATADAVAALLDAAAPDGSVTHTFTLRYTVARPG